MKYLLILLFTGHPAQVVGPFDDLLACEKAATMVRLERVDMGYKQNHTGTVCVSNKNYAFKYKEPPKN